jgi:DNA ligase 1
MSDNDEDVANLQGICEISKDRAIELMAAASGSLERAVDIYFQQSQQQKHAPVTIRNSKNNHVITVDDDDGNIISTSTNLLSKSSPAKRARKTSAVSNPLSRKQGTLHAFLGVPKAETPSKRSQASSADPSSPQPLNGHTNQTLLSPINDPPTRTESSTPAATIQKAGKVASPSKQVDERLSYATLAKAFTEIVDTTKRNAKLNILKTIIMGVIEALGGIHDCVDRQDDARMLTCALELVLGRMSLPNSDAVAPCPLQVSGAAVSTALHTLMPGVGKNQMRESYRRTGDLGDAAAEYFGQSRSVKDYFFVAHSKNRDHNDDNASAGASIARVHGLLQSVATVKPGAGSQKERQALLLKLVRLATTKEELRFLVRTLLGNMRLGATIKSILAALAMAVEDIQKGETVTPQSCEAIQTLQKTHDICPRLQCISLALLRGGVARAVSDCTLEVGVPIQPMLANPGQLADVEKMMTTHILTGAAVIKEAVAEWKYDGMRCQAHYDGVAMKLFSRHLLDQTYQFQDAAAFILEARNDNTVESFIIDAEIVAVSGKDARLLPFQVLSTRRGTKKSDAVNIKVFVFDLMYLNGASLLSKSLWERLELLEKSFRETDGFAFASSTTLGHFVVTEIRDHLSKAFSEGAEGLMVKLTGRLCRTDGMTTRIPRHIPCPYESGARSSQWIKVKRDYVADFADTIDIVPIGAWHGNGRKAEKGFLSPVLFAVYDEDDGVFRSISRCMSFSDKMYAATKDFYFNGTPYPTDVGVVEGDSTRTAPSARDDVNNEIDGSDDEALDETQHDNGEDDEGDHGFVGVNCFPGRPPSSVYITNESPTIWFKPSEVWEVSFADLTLSRTHTAAAGLVQDPAGRGVALRFPRFKRRRPDKGTEQATTSSQIAQLFSKQFKQC